MRGPDASVILPLLSRLTLIADERMRFMSPFAVPGSGDSALVTRQAWVQSPRSHQPLHVPSRSRGWSLQERTGAPTGATRCDAQTPTGTQLG